MINRFRSIALLLFGVSALHSAELTLEQAGETALRNNETIRQVREKLNQKKYQEREAAGNFMPSVQIQAGFNRLNEPLDIDLNPIREAMIRLQSLNQVETANVYQVLQGNPGLSDVQRAGLAARYQSALEGQIPAFTETLKDREYGSVTVTGVQPIFLGGRLVAAGRFAAAERRAAEAELARASNEVVRQAQNQYLGVLLLDRVIGVRRDVVEGMRRHRRDAGRLYEEGLIPRYHVLRADVAVAEAERNLQDDLDRREIARLALRRTLNWPDTASLEPADTLVYRPASDSLACWMDRAMRNQPVLAVIAMKKRAAGQKAAAERAEFLPSVVGFGKYEMLPEYLSALEPRWVVGVQAGMSLFNGGKRINRLLAARALNREVSHLEADAESQVRLWVEKSYREFRDAENRYRKLASDEACAAENLRLNEIRFETGLGASIDVIDGRLALERNRIERARSLVDYYNALSELALASGTPGGLTDIWK
jgi:outer membrane protein TolC